jgi:DNA-binding XRE family transcriptional regulator
MTTKSLSKTLEKQIGLPTFGGFLRSARTMKDMTQTEHANFLKISKSTLCDIEKGRHIVSIELAAQLAKKCGLSEAMAVEYAIQDALRRSGLKLKVRVTETKKAA